MRSGILRHSISIEQVTEVRDARGETTQTWIAFITSTRAAVYPMGGDERFSIHQENNSINHKIVIRYQAGITPKMRVNYGGRIFDIEFVNNVGERNKMINLMCIERL